MSSKLTALTTNPSPVTTDLIYVVPAAGGNQYKAALSAYSLVTGPASAVSDEVAVFSGTSGKIVKQADGPITLTAGGANSDITAKPTGTGDFYILKNTTVSVPWFDGALLTGADATNSGWLTDVYAAQARFDGRRANGTKALPTTLVNADTIVGFAARGYDGTAYSGTQGYIFFTATETWTTTAHGTALAVFVTPPGTTTAISALSFGIGRVVAIGESSSWAAWGTGGVVLNSPAKTYTDRTSSGAVATATLHSFQASTLAAGSSTTFTDTATAYIGGAPIAGTNVTQTNSWALWVDSGNVRLDGTIRTAAAVDWDFGALVTAAVVPDTTRYLAVTVGGVAYKVIIST